jgi:pimeloyl-ACP methyl ester carboxylesterase
VWPLVLLVSHFIRKFMVDYLGDVVAYVNAHEVSEFYEVRQAIQKVGHDIGAAVYALRDPADPQQPFYSRVVMVGHSLGSVLAYDTLDRLLLEDSWRAQPDVLARTAALVTFGSPLDKTAFIFRSQKPVEAEVREALAAGMQPLIAEEKYRLPLKWFNLWSGQDWISGSLSYYDRNPPVEAWKVNNIEDLYANIPMLAHIMYWRSPQLASTLLHCIRL